MNIQISSITLIIFLIFPSLFLSAQERIEVQTWYMDDGSVDTIETRRYSADGKLQIYIAFNDYFIRFGYYYEYKNNFTYSYNLDGTLSSIDKIEGKKRTVTHYKEGMPYFMTVDLIISSDRSRYTSYSLPDKTILEIWEERDNHDGTRTQFTIDRETLEFLSERKLSQDEAEYKISSLLDDNGRLSQKTAIDEGKLVYEIKVQYLE